MIAYLLAGIAALVLISGLAYKTYQAGADSVRLEWSQANAAAQKAADEARKAQEAAREAQDRQATQALALAKRRANTLKEALDVQIAMSTAGSCPIPVGMLDIWNAARHPPEAREGVGTKPVPTPSRTPARPN